MAKEEIRKVTLGELLDTIQEQNPGLKEEELLKLEVKIRTIHKEGNYSTVTKPRDIEFHVQWNDIKRTHEGDFIINCIYA